MASIKQLIAAECNTRAMIEAGGLPPPDEVEYGHTCIRLFWHAPKAAIIVDVDESPDPALEAADRRDDGLLPDGRPPTAATES